MIPEFAELLDGHVEKTHVSYCMIYSILVDRSDIPQHRTIDRNDSQKRNEIVGQFAKRYSNTLDFTHWARHNDRI